jgi:hypothetical protein
LVSSITYRLDVISVELVWAAWSITAATFSGLSSFARWQVGRVVAAAANFFASACSMARGSMRSFAEMITYEDFVFLAATVSSSSNPGL